MKENTATCKQPTKPASAKLASVFVLSDHKEALIEKRLNSTVHVKGRANIKMRDGFCPSCKVVLAIRLKDGSYMDPCDFGDLLPQRRRRKMRKAKPVRRTRATRAATGVSA